MIGLASSPAPLSTRTLRRAGAFNSFGLLNNTDALIAGTGLGHWATTGGGSVSRAAPSLGYGAWQPGVDSLIIGSSADGAGAGLGSTAFPPGLVFKAGHTYELVYAWMCADTPAASLLWSVTFGKYATDYSVNWPQLGVSSLDDVNNWQYWHTMWTPLTDVPASLVTILIKRGIFGGADSGAHDLEIGFVQVLEVPNTFTGLEQRFLSLPSSSTVLLKNELVDEVSILTRRSGHSGANLRMAGGGQNRWDLSAFRHGIYSVEYTPGEASMFSYVEHTAADLSELGFNPEVGVDYLGWFASQKDADTIQFYADVSAGYNLELRDRGSGKGWVTTNAGDTLTSPLARLHHFLTGTVDPTAGVGVAHPQPAMYLRDNAGVTELWLATGAGATAWAKQNSP